MDKRLRNDYLWEKEQIKNVFEGMSIISYKYDVDSYEISFTSNKYSYMVEKGLPPMITLRIMCEWWFEGNIELEENKLNVQEDIQKYAVLSYKLTILMNNNGATIKSIQFNEEYMNINFESGNKFVIPYYDVMDYAWIIYDYSDYYNGWNAICEDGELFVNIPKEE